MAEYDLDIYDDPSDEDALKREVLFESGDSEIFISALVDLAVKAAEVDDYYFDDLETGNALFFLLAHYLEKYHAVDLVMVNEITGMALKAFEGVFHKAIISDGFGKIIDLDVVVNRLNLDEDRVEKEPLGDPKNYKISVSYSQLILS